MEKIQSLVHPQSIEQLRKEYQQQLQKETELLDKQKNQLEEKKEN